MWPAIRPVSTPIRMFLNLTTLKCGCVRAVTPDVTTLQFASYATGLRRMQKRPRPQLRQKLKFAWSWDKLAIVCRSHPRQEDLFRKPRGRVLMHEDFRRTEQTKRSSDRSFGRVMAVAFLLLGIVPLLHALPRVVSPVCTGGAL